jgi:hypothetical protein
MVNSPEVQSEIMPFHLDCQTGIRLRSASSV